MRLSRTRCISGTPTDTSAPAPTSCPARVTPRRSATGVDDAIASETRSPSATRSSTRRSVPSEMRLSSNRPSTSPDSRSVCPRSVEWYRWIASRSLTIPSSRASAMARMPASGVRRSCETHATSSRRERSAACSAARARARRSEVSRSSRRRAANSALPAGRSSAMWPPAPSVRVASPRERLACATRCPRTRAVHTPTRAATAITTHSAPRSWLLRNIACAAASDPAPTAAVAVRATTLIWVVNAARWSVWRRSAPAAPTPSAAPPATATRTTTSAAGSPAASDATPMSAHPRSTAAAAPRTVIRRTGTRRPTP